VVNNDYIERLMLVVEHLHNCRASHTATVPIHEVFRGQTVWEGHVEVFAITGHPKASKCYGWSHPDGPDDTGERFVTVLEIPPVESPITAVRASIVAASKKLRK
jgi:hypothetical protein